MWPKHAYGYCIIKLHSYPEVHSLVILIFMFYFFLFFLLNFIYLTDLQNMENVTRDNDVRAHSLMY